MLDLKRTLVGQWCYSDTFLCIFIFRSLSFLVVLFTNRLLKGSACPQVWIDQNKEKSHRTRWHTFKQNNTCRALRGKKVESHSLPSGLCEDALKSLLCSRSGESDFYTSWTQDMAFTQNLKRERCMTRCAQIHFLRCLRLNISINGGMKSFRMLTAPETEKPVKTKLMSSSFVQMSLTPSTWRLTLVGSDERKYHTKKSQTTKKWSKKIMQASS